MLRSAVRPLRSLGLLLILPAACQAPGWERVAPGSQEDGPQEDGARYVARQDGQVVAVYLAEPNPYKPYVQQLSTPAGVQVLRDSPHDHVHHHALMFALVVDGTNFWEEDNRPGTEATTAVRIDGDTLHSAIAWRDDAGVTLLDERRQVVVAADGAATCLTWRSALTPAADRDAATLGGAHYHGLGMRFAASMDELAAFVHPPGTTSEVVRGTERLTTGDWAACTGRVDGREVTVVMMSHPDHAHPTRWFTMTAPFAYLAATCDGWTAPVTLPHGATLEFVHGVALFDGTVGAEQIQAQFDRWVAATPRPGSTTAR